LSDFNENLNLLINFRKSSNIEFNKNLPDGIKVVPSGRTELGTNRHTDKRTVMTKLIVDFRNFVNASKYVRH